nr:hypothetical protein [Tanacetum cinerariifolium]
MSDDRVFCRLCTCERFRRNYMDKFCSICCFESGNAFIDDLIANSFDDLPNSSDHPFESYHDNPNYGYPPQEPFVYNQDSCYEQNFVDNSQIPPQPQYETYSCELCGNDAHYGYDCPRQVPFVYNQDLCFNQDFDNNFPQTSPKNSSIAITPVLLTEEPDNSLSMGDEHLDTIPETESDEVIKSSVEDLVPIPSESEGIFYNMYDVPFSDKNHFDAESDLIESLLTRDTSIVYFSKIDSLLEEFADIDYVEASPPNSELVSLEEVKDDILRAKLWNIHLFIAKIESLNNNPTPVCVLKSPSSSFLSYIDNSSPEFETFSYHTEETSSGSTTTLANNSLLEYDSFLFEIEPDQGELTSIVINDILDNSTNDPLMEEINLFLTLDNLIPPGIKNVYYDSEGDIFSLNNCLEMIPFPFLSLNHFILIFMMNHHLLVLRKNHLMMVAF